MILNIVSIIVIIAYAILISYVLYASVAKIDRYKEDDEEQLKYIKDYNEKMEMKRKWLRIDTMSK